MEQATSIVIPISRFEKSGGIRVLCALANGLAKKNYAVSFLVPRGQHEPVFPLDPRVKIDVIGADMGELLYVSGLLKKLQLLIGMPKTEIAIANAYMTAYAVKLAHLQGRVKRPLYFIQGYEPFAFGKLSRDPKIIQRIKTAIATQTYRLGLECAVNSHWLQGILEERHFIHSTVVRLGVDSTIFKPLAAAELHSPLRIMAIGDGNAVKRMGLLVETLALLDRTHPCEAWIATGQPAFSLQAGVPTTVHFPQNDDELAAVYSQADFFVSTSQSEGFSLPLLEAMACGIPVVTTDSGGMRDFCRDGYNCRIIASDRPGDLAQVIRDLAENQSLRARFIQNGLETARQWSWENLAMDFEQIILTGGQDCD